MPIPWIIVAALICLGFFFGRQRELAHLHQIQLRESDLGYFPATTGLMLPGQVQMDRPSLVTGSVVISVDYFKRIVATLKMLTGGRIHTYETLLERARREAVLRMKQDAINQGADGIINVRIETSRLANGRGDDGVAGVEVLAFGTAVRT